MNLNKLQTLISKGESENLEFKNSTGQRTAAMKAVCGMLNGLGGFVLFGVTDKGEIKGQDINASTMAAISAELSRIDPPAFPDIETVTLENAKSVIALRIPGGGGLYTYDGRPYIRTGPTTRVMPKEEYERRLMDRLHSTRRWENESVPGSVTISDLDEDEIQTTLSNAVEAGRIDRPRKTDTRSILTGLGLIVDGRLTNASVVLYGKSKRLEAFYPQCAIHLGRFRGTDRLADLSDNRKYWGNAFSLLQRAERFFLDHMQISGKVIPGRMKREDHPQYPPRAIREALANAICHRDYTIPGASVSVAIYDDRMEIVNPGSLRFGLTPESLTEPHESKPWNPLIANVFYRAGIIEQWGTGTLNIIDWCRENSNPEPAWSLSESAVYFSMKPFQEKRAEKKGTTTQSATQSATQSSDSVVRLLGALDRGPLSSAEIRDRLNLKHRPTLRKNYLHPALEKRYIEMTIPEKPQSRLQKYRLTEKGSMLLHQKNHNH